MDPNGTDTLEANGGQGDVTASKHRAETQPPDTMAASS